MLVKWTSGSVVTRKAFDFLSSKGETKAGAPFDGREMSMFLVKRLQVKVYYYKTLIQYSHSWIKWSLEVITSKLRKIFLMTHGKYYMGLKWRHVYFVVDSSWRHRRLRRFTRSFSGDSMRSFQYVNVRHFKTSKSGKVLLHDLHRSAIEIGVHLVCLQNKPDAFVWIASS